MGGQLSSDLLAAVVCDKMGWTLAEFYETPETFVQALLIKWQEDARKQNDDNKK